MYAGMLLPRSWIFQWIRHVVLVLSSPALTVTLIRLLWAGKLAGAPAAANHQSAGFKRPAMASSRPRSFQSLSSRYCSFSCCSRRTPLLGFLSFFFRCIVTESSLHGTSSVCKSSLHHCRVHSVIFMSLIASYLTCVSTALSVFPFCTPRHSRWIGALPASSIISSWTTFVI